MPHSSAVTAGNDIYAADHNSLRKDVMLGGRIAETKAGAAIVTLDFSDVTKGNIKTINVDQDIILRFSGITVYPTIFFVRFVMDASGGHTITIDQNGVRFPSGVAPTISDGANEVTGLMFICLGANDFDCYFAGFGLLTES